MLPNPVNWEAELHRTALLLACHPKNQAFWQKGTWHLLGAMESLHKTGCSIQILLCILLFHNIPQ